MATFRKIGMSKRKNLDPWGGAPAAPPGSANAIVTLLPQSLLCNSLFHPTPTLTPNVLVNSVKRINNGVS